jgi:hypothetical protein
MVDALGLSNAMYAGSAVGLVGLVLFALLARNVKAVA